MTTTVCTVPGCDGQTFNGADYCRSHAKRNHHYGHPLRIMRCEVVGGPLATPCLIVRKPHLSGSNRYPRVSIDGEPWQAHRFIWTAHHGPIPDGLHVLHACDTPACVRIDHLSLGTHAENMADMAAKGRGVCPPGEGHGMAKLTDDQVQAIRRRYAAGGVTHRDLAAEYGAHHCTIGRIVRREAWRHVD